MSLYTRTVFGIAVGIAAAIVLVGFLLWYLAYSLPEDPPADVSLSGLTSEATIHWGPYETINIEAGSEADAFAALGFAHARNQGWSALLWRQVALGKLTEWFGTPVEPIDRQAHRLRIADGARAAFTELDDGYQELLRMYVDGMNAALETRAARFEDERSLLRVGPIPWQPWHPLAVERLTAWLSTAPLTAHAIPRPEPMQPLRPILEDEAQASPLPEPDPPGFDRYLSDDTLLRSFLGLHALNQGVTISQQSNNGIEIFHRQPYGTSALPLFQTVRFSIADADPIAAATIPGTPILPAGASPNHQWAVQLSGVASFEWVEADTAHTQPFPGRYHRARMAAGSDHALHQTWRLEDGRILLPDTTVAAEAGRALALRWEENDNTDIDAWASLLGGGSTPEFTLFSGHGLVTRGNDLTTIGGVQQVVEVDSDTRIHGTNDWIPYLAARLRALQEDPGDVILSEATQRDVHSAWAHIWLPQMLFDVEQAMPQDLIMRQALAYLRNWDYRFDESSIAASIVDRWAHHVMLHPGTLPGFASPEPEKSLESLRTALAELEQSFGSDLSQWRWERVGESELRYPVWSADTLLTQTRLRARDRFAPHRQKGFGHPSTLAGMSGRLGQQPASPAHWEAFFRSDGTMKTRQTDVRARRFLERYMAQGRSPYHTRITGPALDTQTTRLSPSSN